MHGKDWLVGRGSGENGNLSDVPWASVFDPAANARALSAIQAEGFRAASELVDRFVGLAGLGGNGGERTPATNGAERTPATSAAGIPNAVGASVFGGPDFERLMKSWWSVTGQFLLGSARIAGLPTAGGASFDLTKADGKGLLELDVALPGRATSEVWLHNRGPDDLGLVRLHCSDLLAHDGCVVPSSAMHIEPNPVPMPRRSSRGVSINVDASDGVHPGVYRGNLLADGHPDLWLPVVLTIRMPGT